MSERTTPPDVDALARRLRPREPSLERSHEMRRALLEAADEPVPRRWTRGRVIGLAGIAAAAACAAIALRAPETRAPARPAVATDGAAPALPVDGIAAFATERPVQLARSGASITAPAGARFEVEVRDGQLRRVTVNAAWVVIASAHGATTLIPVGQTWTFTAVIPPAESTQSPAPVAPDPQPPSASSRPSPPPPPPRAPAASSPPLSPRASRSPALPAPSLPRVASSDPAAPSPPPRDESPASTPPSHAAAPPPRPVPPAGEQAFRAGLHALTAGDARAAVGALDHACGTASSNQDDACYWAAVAWLRLGDRLRARAAFADVVERWPRSTHAGEANLALGWLLLDIGDRDGARARFAAAVDDPIPSVRADARRGLTATAP
jgi:TolA-binding protein